MEPSTDQQEAYAEELRKARSTDLSGIRNRNAVFAIKQNGDFARDSDGNTIVVLIPSLIPNDEEDAWEKAFQLFLCETEQICASRYRVVYIHSGFSPPLWFGWWLFGLRSRVSYAHRKNIQALTIIHPSLTVRLLFLGLRPILGANFWRKLHYADRVEELWLDEVMPEALVRASLPRMVMTYESKIVQEAEDMRDVAIAMGAPLMKREEPVDIHGNPSSERQ